jgi:site-specific recombinase XerD
MLDLTTIQDIGFEDLLALVTNALASEQSRRAYARALRSFFEWYFATPRGPLSKALVLEYKSHLRARQYSSATVNLHLSAIRKLAQEASDNELLDASVAGAIGRVRGSCIRGVRTGNWLGHAQAQHLLDLPDTATLKGKRDSAILSMLLGCALRRNELSILTIDHIQLREERWVVSDLISKHERVRTIAIPSWSKQALDRWVGAANIDSGRVFRSIDKADRITGVSISPQAVYDVVQTYAARAGLSRIAPHDLRRSFAKLAFAAGSELEQIQFCLGHASVVTTERYIGTRQKLKNTPGDRLHFTTCDDGPLSTDPREE